MRHRDVSVIFLCFLFASSAAWAYSRRGRPEAEGSDPRLAQRIFANEQMTIAQISKRTPILEAYVQSLDPEVSPESVLDDAYLLGKLGLNVDAPRLARFQSLAFGASPQTRRIRVNTGDHWVLYPEGYVDMLFIDLGEFDEDHYVLTEEGREQLAGCDCLRVKVQPLESRNSGRFSGQIWIDEASFAIVRIRGSFSPKRLGAFSKYFNPSGISRMGLYFHFESWRQQVAPGVWLPSYTYFDERRLWNVGNLTTSFHLRGHIWLWKYQTADRANSHDGVDHPLEVVEASGLVASRGDVEQGLNRVVEEIENGSELGTDINCRVLLTTPIEIFSLDKTIFVSRGLLNVVPDEGTLAGLLAFEIAHITLGHSRVNAFLPPPVFEAQRTSDFPGFGVKRDAEEEDSARELMRSLLAGTKYAGSANQVEAYWRASAHLISNVPHLAIGLWFQRRQASRPADKSPMALQLRGQYGINSWDDRVVATKIGTKGEAATVIRLEP